MAATAEAAQAMATSGDGLELVLNQAMALEATASLEGTTAVTEFLQENQAAAAAAPEVETVAGTTPLPRVALAAPGMPRQGHLAGKIRRPSR